MMVLALKGLLWCALAVAGLVAIDVAVAPLPSVTAWGWTRMPSWVWLAVLANVYRIGGNVFGAWRFHRFNPTPGAPDEHTAIYRPTALGRWNALRQANVVERAQSHPLAALMPQEIQDRMTLIVRRNRMHMDGASWAECKAAGILPEVCKECGREKTGTP